MRDSAELFALFTLLAFVNQITRHGKHGGDAKHKQSDRYTQRHFAPRTEIKLTTARIVSKSIA
jgi:hypothetical protein